MSERICECGHVEGAHYPGGRCGELYCRCRKARVFHDSRTDFTNEAAALADVRKIAGRWRDTMPVGSHAYTVLTEILALLSTPAAPNKAAALDMMTDEMREDCACERCEASVRRAAVRGET